MGATVFMGLGGIDNLHWLETVKDVYMQMISYNSLIMFRRED